MSRPESSGSELREGDLNLRAVLCVVWRDVVWSGVVRSGAVMCGAAWCGRPDV